jgi:hypothetical protein
LWRLNLSLLCRGGTPVDVFHYMGPRDGTQSWAGFFFVGSKEKDMNVLYYHWGPYTLHKTMPFTQKTQHKIQVTLFNWSLYEDMCRPMNILHSCDASSKSLLPATIYTKKQKKKKNVGPANTVEVDKARSVWALSFLYRFSLKKKERKIKSFQVGAPHGVCNSCLMGKKKKKNLKISIYLNPKQKKVAYLIDEICSSRLQGFRVNYMNMNVSRSVYKENICNMVMAKNPHML